jgi:hypothetical protein
LSVSEHDDWLERAVRVLREPVHIDPMFDRRVMAAIEREPTPRRGWLRAVRRPFGERVALASPVGGLALAAAVALGVLIGRTWLVPERAERPAAVTMTSASGAEAVQFVIVVPGATSVALVGDFNDWNRTATPMEVAAGDGVWAVTVPLETGRYRYAFLVDGTRWLADPSAPRSLDDDFGPPNSVVTVGAT